MAALMWQMGGFGPMPHQFSHFQSVKNEADRRYGIERYSKETRRLYDVLDKRFGQSIPDLNRRALG
jgi:GST-like protein